MDSQEQGQAERTQISGQVKWFDPVKGYGFIVAETGGADILLHANVLRNYGQGSVADGALIEVHVQMTQRGAQAVEIIEIRPPANVTFVLGDDIPADFSANTADLPIEPVRIKWFDKSKGFGFANAFGRPEDIFVHVEVLRQSGFADLQPGEAVGLRVIEGKRGRMAIQVLSWESALRSTA